jgi:hypothetical protein
MKFEAKIFSLLLMGLFLTACGEDRSAQMRQQLVGNWEHEYRLKDNGVVKGVSQYREDFTVETSSEYFRGGMKMKTSKQKGTWDIVDEQLILHVKEEGAASEIKLKVPLLDVNENEYRFILEKEGELFERRVQK